MVETTYVLVPGAGGVAWYWHLVRDELGRRGVPSTAVDLPGDDPQLGLPHYVDLVTQALAGHDDVVLVGQSLGGFTAAWVAAEQPVSALVLVNAMIPRPGESAGQWWEATGAPQARRDADIAAGRDPDAPFDVVTAFLHDVPDAVVAESSSHQRDESDAVFVHPWGAAAWTTAPTRVLAGADDRFFPPSFQRRVAHERLGLDAELIPGGHLAALSRPVDLVDALLRRDDREVSR